jgi:membrane-bound ClpP family serine protease
MQRPSLDATAYLVAGAIGIALIVLARWASRSRGSRLDSWVALRIGDALFTEVLGAFLVGAGIGGVVMLQLTAAGPPRGIPPPPGRFGGFNSSQLPFVLGAAGAALAVLTRVDIGAALLRSSAARGTVSAYVGSEARVVSAIPAGGSGEIVFRDGSGTVVGVAATAETDIPAGATVRIVGRNGVRPIVAPIAASDDNAVERRPSAPLRS